MGSRFLGGLSGGLEFFGEAGRGGGGGLFGGGGVLQAGERSGEVVFGIQPVSAAVGQ